MTGRIILPPGSAAQQNEQRAVDIGGDRLAVFVRPGTALSLDPNAPMPSVVTATAQLMTSANLYINALVRHVEWLTQRVEQLEALSPQSKPIAPPWPVPETQPPDAGHN